MWLDPCSDGVNSRMSGDGACMPTAWGRILMEDFSIPKDDVKVSQPTLGPPFHHLTHNLRPSQATLASHSTFPRLDATEVVLSPTDSSSTGRLIANLQHLPRIFGERGAEQEAAARLLLWLAGKSLAKNS